MPRMNFDLEDGLPEVSFDLKLADTERFCKFMADCTDAIKSKKRLKERIAELEAAQAQAVPDGWKLVPIEPTEEMIAAGRSAPCTDSEDDVPEDYRRVYQAMLTAAPTPAAQKPETKEKV